MGLVVEVASHATNGFVFLVASFFVFHWLTLLQERYGRVERRRSSSLFYRGGKRGNRTNAEWFVHSLLEPSERLRSNSVDSRPPEWERRFPNRAVAHDHDNAGTTVHLSTADMLNIRWDLPLSVCMEMGLFADLIVRDFILYWYSESISKEPQFPDDVRNVLQNVLGKLADRILSVNLPMFILCDLSYVLRHHLRWFSELKVRAKKRCHPQEEFERISVEDRNKLLLEEFRRAGHLHPACSLTGQTEDPRTTAYIRSITSELLVRLLPEEDYQCAALRHLVREVLTCNVLIPALDSITPDVLNVAILQGLRGTEDEASGGVDGKSGDKQKEDQDNDEHDVDDDVNYKNGEEKEEAERKQAEMDRLEQRKQMSLEALEQEKCTESIDFIQKANMEMRKEEAGRLMLELRAALGDCVNVFTSNPDVPLTQAKSSARQLLRILDNILEHGLIFNARLNMESSGASLLVPCEPWWEYVRQVSDLLPSTAMITNAIDSVVEALLLDGDDDAGDTGATAGSGSLGGEKSIIPDSKKGHADRTEQESKQEKHASARISRKSGLEDGILQPGMAWLAMMLKHNLLAEAIGALLQDKEWTNLHYEETSALHAAELLPMLETLNGVAFEFDLDKFWENSNKVKKQLEKRGVKATRQEKLRRMRKRLAEKLARNIKLKRSSKHTVPHKLEQAIVALQDRVGPVRVKIDRFTLKHERGGVRNSTFVQYIIECELTRREDGQVSCWTIFRRYSQFNELHSQLKSRFGYRFDDISMPKKSGFSVFSSQSVSFINKRKVELEQYLQAVLEHPTVSDSEEVLTFLSPQTEEEFTASGASAAEEQQLQLQQDDLSSLNHLDSADSTLSTSATTPTSQRSSVSETTPAAATSVVEQEKKDTEDHEKDKIKEKKQQQQKSATPPPSKERIRGRRSPTEDKEPKIDPYELRIAEGHLYKLAQEIFDFHELDIVRRNLISVFRSVVSLVFQGTAHRWLKDNYTRNASAEILASLLSKVRELMWPNGEFMETEEEIELSPEQLQEMAKNREESLQELLDAVPPQLIKFLGKKKAHESCKKLHEFLQHPSLIHNLVFTIMDLLLLRIFPDLPLQDLHTRKSST